MSSNFNYPTDALRRKWEPVLQWLPQAKTAQITVLTTQSVSVPLQYILSVIELESNGIPDAITGDAHGLMQLTHDAGVSIDWSKIMNPQYNVIKGTETLATKYKECGQSSWDSAILAYFGGGCSDTGASDILGTSQSDYLDHIRKDVLELSAIGIGETTLPNTGSNSVIDTAKMAACLAKCNAENIARNGSSKDLDTCKQQCGFTDVSTRINNVGGLLNFIFSSDAISRLILFLVGVVIFIIAIIRITA